MAGIMHALLGASGMESAKLVEVVPQTGGHAGTLAWTPNTGQAKVGDLAIRVGQGAGGGWANLGNFSNRFLSSEDMTTTFMGTSISEPRYLVLRDVAGLALRYSGTSKTISGFAKSPTHVGLLIHTIVSPDSLIFAPGVSIGSTNIPATMRYYSAPADANSTRNLHCVLSPPFDRYVDGTGFQIVAGSAGVTTSIVELLA